MIHVLTAARLLTADGPVDDPVLVLDEDRVVSVRTRGSAGLPPGSHHDYPGATLSAAYFDVHVHGCCGRDVMEGTGEALDAVGRFLATHGVGAYFPTTITAPREATLRSLGTLAEQIARGVTPGVARPLGIHIEGPFLSHGKKGAHPPEHLLPPTVAFFDQMWEAAAGQIRLMTIAPELPGALDVITRAKELGVRVSLGHSNATYAEAEAAISAGADSSTHTFNAMRTLEQREPGILGAVLGAEQLYSELICDGLHVHPAVVRLFWKLKGPERAILITDAMSGTGMPDGVYKLGELEVRLVDGRCLIGENTLAGSTLTLDAAVRNFAEFTGVPLAVAARLASLNPARMAGFEGVVGTVLPGGRADLVVLSPEGAVQATWIGGRMHQP